METQQIAGHSQLMAQTAMGHQSAVRQTIPADSLLEDSLHGSTDSGNISGNEQGSDEGHTVDKMGHHLHHHDMATDGSAGPHQLLRAGQKRTPAEIEEAVMRKKLRNRESAQRARDRQKAR